MARIIIIDDDQDMCSFIQMVLQKAGHQTETANSVARGLALYHDNPTDLIITDIIMPRMDGLELIAEVMRINPQSKVLAMSGGGRLLGADYVLKVASHFKAAVHTLAKPFSQEMLMCAVNQALAVKSCA